MLKKTLKALKLILIGILWTAVFLFLARWLLMLAWKFDIFYKNQWNVVSRYWNSNGVIMGAADYGFFATLFLCLLVWIFGWRWFYKMDYLQTLLYPFEYIANYQIKKYEKEDNRTIIKNIVVAEKLTLEDVIQEKIKQEKSQKTKASQELRQNILEKIIKRKE